MNWIKLLTLLLFGISLFPMNNDSTVETFRKRALNAQRRRAYQRNKRIKQLQVEKELAAKAVQKEEESKRNRIQSSIQKMEAARLRKQKSRQKERKDIVSKM